MGNRMRLTDTPNFAERADAVLEAPTEDERISRLYQLFSLRDLLLIEKSLTGQRKRGPTLREKKLLALIDRQDLPGLINTALRRADAGKSIQAASDPYAGGVFKRATGRDLPVVG